MPERNSHLLTIVRQSSKSTWWSGALVVVGEGAIVVVLALVVVVVVPLELSKSVAVADFDAKMMQRKTRIMASFIFCVFDFELFFEKKHFLKYQKRI